MLQQAVKTGFHSFMSISDSVRVHSHYGYYEFGYVYSGSAVSKIANGEEQIITAGDYYIIDTYTQHKYTAIDMGSLSVFNIGFTKDLFGISVGKPKTLSAVLELYFPSLGSEYKLPCITDRVFHDENMYIRDIIEKIRYEYKAQNFAYRENIRNLFSCILTETMRKAGIENSINESATVIPKIIDIIEKESSKPLKLGEICKRFGYNLSYISRAFKKEAGMSFCEYLQKTRINKSCLLLTTTNDKINVIAELVGYSDIKFFNHLFKKYIGKTPKEYRNDK